MPTTSLQLRAIALNEYRMHWRRQALKVIALALGLMLALIIVLAQSDDTRAVITNAGLDDSDLRQVLSFTIVFTTGAVVTMIAAFILPVAFADTVPLDRQLGVRELLDTLPLPIWVYLVGKLLGLWLAVGSAMAAIMIASAIGWWVTLGAYDLGAYLSLWIVGVGGLIVLNGGFGLLLTATQPNRRRAVLLVIGVLIVLIFGLGMPEKGNVLAYLNPLRLPIIMHYLGGTEALSDAPGHFGRDDVRLALVIGLGELVALGAVVWAWTRYQMTDRANR